MINEVVVQGKVWDIYKNDWGTVLRLEVISEKGISFCIDFSFGKDDLNLIENISDIKKGSMITAYGIITPYDISRCKKQRYKLKDIKCNIEQIKNDEQVSNETETNEADWDIAL